MKLVLDCELRLIATHDDHQDVVGCYPSCHVVRVGEGGQYAFGERVDIALEVLQTAACDVIDPRRRNYARRS